VKHEDVAASCNEIVTRSWQDEFITVATTRPETMLATRRSR